MKLGAVLRAFGAVTALAFLPACKLIDQTTFDPDAGKPPLAAAATSAAPAASEPPSGTPAFLRVPLNPEPDWRGAVRDGVAAARRRKPDVQFDVVAVVPAAGTAEQQATAADTVVEPASRIAAAIRSAGVPAGRVRLLARLEEGVAAPEVRVFVR